MPGGGQDPVPDFDYALQEFQLAAAEQHPERAAQCLRHLRSLLQDERRGGGGGGGRGRGPAAVSRELLQTHEVVVQHVSKRARQPALIKAAIGVLHRALEEARPLVPAGLLAGRRAAAGAAEAAAHARCGAAACDLVTLAGGAGAFAGAGAPQGHGQGRGQGQEQAGEEQT